MSAAGAMALTAVVLLLASLTETIASDLTNRRQGGAALLFGAACSCFIAAAWMSYLA